MRLGQRAVVRAAVNPGGDAGDKAPPELERYRMFFSSLSLGLAYWRRSEARFRDEY